MRNDLGSDPIVALGAEAAVPYGIDRSYDYALAVLGVGGSMEWRLTPDELRTIADEVERDFESDEQEVDHDD